MFDLTIDFGYKSPEQGRMQATGKPAEWHHVARITMSPAHAKSLLALLATQIQQYETQFGELPSTHHEDNRGGG